MSIEGNHKLANKHHDRIRQIAAEFRASGVLQQLIPLTTHEHLGVRGWAAMFLLELDESTSIKALEGIVALNEPHHSFNAELTLKEWKKGNFSIWV